MDKFKLQKELALMRKLHNSLYLDDLKILIQDNTIWDLIDSLTDISELIPSEEIKIALIQVVDDRIIQIQGMLEEE